MVRTIALALFLGALTAPIAAFASEHLPRGNYGDSLRWYFEAAEAGNARAQFLLGLNMKPALMSNATSRRPPTGLKKQPVRIIRKLSLSSPHYSSVGRAGRPILLPPHNGISARHETGTRRRNIILRSYSSMQPRPMPNVSMAWCG